MSLTLMTSHRESKLTQKSIEMTKAYYQAEAKANALFLEIGEIYNIYYTTGSKRQDILKKALAEVTNITKVELGEPSYVYYEVPINEEQVIEVVIEMDKNLHMRSWKVKKSSIWTYKEEGFGEIKIS